MSNVNAVAAVAAKFDAPFEVWVLLNGHGSFSLDDDPGAWVGLFASQQAAIDELKNDLIDRFTTDNAEWNDIDETSLEGPDREDYDKWVIERDKMVADGIKEALTGGNFVYENEVKYFFSIRKLPVKS